MCKYTSFLLVIAFLLSIHKVGADPCNICDDDDATFNEQKIILGGISCATLNDQASLFEEDGDCEGYQAYGLECECSNLIETEFACKICPDGEDLPDPDRYIPFPEGTCGGFETAANLLVTDEEERYAACDDAQRLAPYCCDDVDPFCTVCSPLKHVTIHDRVVPEFDPITCGQLEAVAVTFRDPVQCLNAQLAARDFADFDGCGCEFIEDPFPLDEVPPEETGSPSVSPSKMPSSSPSASPSPLPSAPPSVSPSMAPTQPPSEAPSLAPSATPTDQPSYMPSSSPSVHPSPAPSPSPSAGPSLMPSESPTGSPTSSPAPTAYTLPRQKTRAPIAFGTGERSYGSGGRGGAGNGGGGRGGAGAGGGGTGGGFGRLLRGVIGHRGD
jgi:hypothetical protein